MSNIKKILCFDLDGTLADLYNVPNWLEKLQASDPSPYREAKPIYNMQKLISILNILIKQGWEVRIISWLAKNSTKEYKTAVRKAKREWLAKYKFPCTTAHLIAYGTTKADSVRNIAAPAILIDDNYKIRKGWHLGETIDPINENLIERLQNLVEG